MKTSAMKTPIMARSSQGLSCETFGGGEPVDDGAEGVLGVATAAVVRGCSIPDSVVPARGGDDCSWDTDVVFVSLPDFADSGGFFTCSCISFGGAAPFSSSSGSIPLERHISLHSCKASAFVLPCKHSQRHSLDFCANILRTSSGASTPPIWPLGSPSMKLRIATSAVRIPHAGCHVSSWCPLILRQISRLTSNRPDGVRNRNEGGRSGYCGGRTIRPWYTPPAYGDGAGGPAIVKCQSKRFESDTGWAKKCGDGDGEDADSSAASFISRRVVADMLRGLGSMQFENEFQ